MEHQKRSEVIAIAVALIAVAVIFGASYVSSPFSVGSATTGTGDGIVELVNESEVLDQDRVVELQGSSANQASAIQALRGAMNPEGELTKLIIEDVSLGDGEEVKEGDEVSVHYVGALTDGTQFDTSRTRGEPYTFVVGEGSVIEGWDIGILGMKKGGTRILVIPPDLAYGTRANGPIPANSTLVFSIELVEIAN